MKKFYKISFTCFSNVDTEYMSGFERRNFLVYKKEEEAILAINIIKKIINDNCRAGKVSFNHVVRNQKLEEFFSKQDNQALEKMLDDIVDTIGQHCWIRTIDSFTLVTEEDLSF
jgi:protoporphyrinogen oxidase